MYISYDKARSMLLSGEITVPELTRIFLDRIKAFNDEYGAFITVCEEYALAQAHKAQKIIDGGNAPLLCGIPVAIKDNICTKDIKTTCGSKMLEDFVSPYSATAVKRLEAQGAVIIGKTALDEFAMGSTGQNCYFCKTKNPYNPQYIPGGSSSGSAVAVALNMCIIALGSDTGGSVRQPAAFCSVTGIKPTYSRVSRYGLVAFSSSLDQIGVIAENSHVASIALDAICGFDKNDLTTKNINDSILSDFENAEDKPYRLAVVNELFDCAEDDIKYHILSAADFYKGKGYSVDFINMPSLEYGAECYYLISSAQAASNLSRFDGVRYGLKADENNYEDAVIKSRNQGFGKEVKRRIMLGNYALSSGFYDEYYKKALAVKQRISEEYSDAFKSYDVILSPAFPSRVTQISQINQNPAQIYKEDMCTVSANLAGLPSLAIPCGYDSNGMPVGMMLTADKFKEATLLKIASLFENEFERKLPDVIKD